MAPYTSNEHPVLRLGCRVPVTVMFRFWESFFGVEHSVFDSWSFTFCNKQIDPKRTEVCVYSYVLKLDAKDLYCTRAVAWLDPPRWEGTGNHVCKPVGRS